MKKIISILIVLCMLLSVSALAENYEVGVSFQVNKEQTMKVLPMLGANLSSSGANADVIGTALDILSSISLHVIAGEDGGLGEVLLRGVELFNLGVVVDDGLKAFTDLLPGYAVSVSGQTLQTAMSMVPDVSGFDIAPYQAILLRYIASIKTSSEQGLYFKQGKMYPNLIVVTLNGKDTFNMLNALVDQFEKDMNDLGILSILNTIGADIDFDDLRVDASRYEDASADINVYLSQNGKEFCIEFTEDILLSYAKGMILLTAGNGYTEINASLIYGEDGFELDFTAGESSMSVQISISAKSVSDGYTIREQMNIARYGNTVSLLEETNVVLDGDKCDVKGSVYFMDMSAPVLTFTVNAVPYAGAIPAPDFNACNVLSVEDLIANGLDDATLQGIESVLMNQTLSGLVVKLLTAAPEFAGQIMQLMTQVSKPNW